MGLLAHVGLPRGSTGKHKGGHTLGVSKEPAKSVGTGVVVVGLTVCSCKLC